MAKTGKASVAKRIPAKASKSKPIKKAKSAKSTTVPATPARKSSSKQKGGSKQKWAAPYEKKIKMFKEQPDYFVLNQKYSGQ